MSNSRKQRFLALASLSCEHAHPMPTKRLPSSPARLLCRSPGPGPSGSSLGCPRPSLLWVMNPTLAHTRPLTTYGLTHACFTHRHRRHALPLHTCSSTAPPKHSPAQNGHGPPLGSRGSPTSAAFLGSSQCVSGTATTARRRQAFEIHLVDLLWPQPPLT